MRESLILPDGGNKKKNVYLHDTEILLPFENLFLMNCQILCTIDELWWEVIEVVHE